MIMSSFGSQLVTLLLKKKKPATAFQFYQRYYKQGFNNFCPGDIVWEYNFLNTHQCKKFSSFVLIMNKNEIFHGSNMSSCCYLDVKHPSQILGPHLLTVFEEAQPFVGWNLARGSRCLWNEPQDPQFRTESLCFLVWEIWASCFMVLPS